MLSAESPSLDGLIAHAVEEAWSARAEAVAPIHLPLAVFGELSPEGIAHVAIAGLDVDALRGDLRAFGMKEGATTQREPSRVSSRVTFLLEKARAYATREEREVDPLDVAADAFDALATAGFAPDRGAREMERVVERQIVQPLATGLLDGTFARGARVRVEAGPGGAVLRRA